MGNRVRVGASLAHIESLEVRQLLADVVGLTLINAQTDQPVPVFSLVNGSIMDLKTVGRQLNIRAETTGGTPGSVRFNFDGNPAYKIESVAPFCIGGDDKGGKDYLPWTPTPGTHTLIVTPYSGAGGVGSLGKGKMLTFQVVDSNPPTAATSIVRINAGGGAFTVSGGHLFSPDSGFTGGVKSSSVFPVAGTIDDPLYQSRRYGAKFTFSKPADNGSYTLTLHFVEPTFTKANQRKFDVLAEGALIIDDLDLVKTVGAKKALLKTFNVNVTDGKLDLLFQSSIENAIVSGIELTPVASTPAGLTVPAPVYVDAGGSGLITDSVGRVFEPDSGFTGGNTGSAGVADASVTENGALFDTFHAGSAFTFSHPAANGHYTLFLEFADPTSTDIGQRSFDVSAEGTPILNHFDIFAASAARQTPIAKKFDVTIVDGSLDLAFDGVVGSALVSQIELVPTDIPPAMLPYSGIEDQPAGALHDALLAAWKTRSASNLRQIAEVLQLYANDNKGNYPPDLKTGAMWVPVDISTYADPRISTLTPRGQVSVLELGAWVEAQTDYVYVGAGLRTNAPAEAVLAYENPNTTPGDVLNVLYADGHVGEVARADLVAQFGGSALSPTPLPRPMQTATDPKVFASQANLRTIAQAMLQYTNDFKGVLPPDFGTLYLTEKSKLPNGVTTFLNPRGSTFPPPLAADDNVIAAYINTTTDYLYPAAGQKLSKATVLAYENPAGMKDGINILFADGRVEFREMRWALETLAGAHVAGIV